MFRKVVVNIDGHYVGGIECWEDPGRDMGGYVYPYMRRADMADMRIDDPEHITYDAATDTYTLTAFDGEVAYDARGMDITVGGATIHVYPIGEWEFQWEYDESATVPCANCGACAFTVDAHGICPTCVASGVH